MKRLALVLLLAGCASTPEPTPEPAKEPGMWVTHREGDVCNEGGGCALATKEQINRALIDAWLKGYEIGKKEEKASCWANS